MLEASVGIRSHQTGYRLTFEEGNPENKFTLAVNWAMNGFGATLRATRYGDALSPQNAPTVTAPDFVLTAKTCLISKAAMPSTTRSRSRSVPTTCSTNIRILCRRV